MTEKERRGEKRGEERREEEHTEGGRQTPLFAALKASEFQAESRRSPTQQYSSFLGLRVQSVDNENLHPPPPCSLVYKIFVSFLLNDGSYVKSNIQICAFIFKAQPNKPNELPADYPNAHLL